MKAGAEILSMTYRNVKQIILFQLHLAPIFYYIYLSVIQQPYSKINSSLWDANAWAVKLLWSGR